VLTALRREQKLPTQRELLRWRPGEAPWRRAPGPSGASLTLQRPHGPCQSGTVLLQAAARQCRGHPKETALSGNEVAWLLLKLHLK